MISRNFFGKRNNLPNKIQLMELTMFCEFRTVLFLLGKDLSCQTSVRKLCVLLILYSPNDQKSYYLSIEVRCLRPLLI